jgi:uncharacterized protein
VSAVTLEVGGGVSLEAELSIPAGARAGVVLCHPHPLYGGDMESNVVVRAAEACAARHVATLRFNFRGVGASTGKHDDGRGEQQDVRAALAELHRRVPAGAPVALAGYSFGAAVAAAVARDTPIGGLALIAPPIPITPLTPPVVTGPLLILVGTDDQYCSAESLKELRDSRPEITLTVIDGADHFFFGALDDLGAAVEGWAAALAS